MSQPITELRNPITTNIDVASPLEFLRLLRRCDEEIFTGFEGSQGLLAPGIVGDIDKICTLATGMLKDPVNSIIIFSGCGTSGRIGFITARTYNRNLTLKGHNPCFDYILAGGDQALFRSAESCEDDPINGIETLKQLCDGKRRVLYIGITCGLSAPFIAGQLDYCLQNPDKFTPVLLGFNYVHQARNRDIENWDKTFLQVAENLEAASRIGRAFIINPIVGPEPITGSSRMKGGSATKIILDVICTRALNQMINLNNTSSVEEDLDTFRLALGFLQKEESLLAEIVQSAGESLKLGGHVYYLGRDTCGILGMIDASECQPTFGADPDDICGLVYRHTQLCLKSGDLSDLENSYLVTIDQFLETKAKTLTSNDLVIACDVDISDDIVAPAKKVTISVTSLPKPQSPTSIPGKSLYVNIDKNISLNEPLQELTYKLILNAISTGAHVMKGKIYENIMVDVKVSNIKLYHRGVHIIQTLSACSMEKAQNCLLQSIYHTDSTLSSDIKSSSITAHVKMACQQKQIVPLALIMALTDCTLSEARTRLASSSIIRTAISQVIAGRTM